MSERNFVGFRLRSEQVVDAWGLGKSDSAKEVITSILQRDDDPHHFQLVVVADGAEESAVLKATGWLWNFLEQEEVTAEIERVTYGHIDYTHLAREVIAAQLEIINLIVPE